MLTFLRKIRRSLIDTGSTQKYLLYAIGEITLVVIGILIALQINNWNGIQKDKKIVNEYLFNIGNNIVQDTKGLDSLIVTRKEIHRACDMAMEHFFNKRYDQELFTQALASFIEIYFVPNTSGYDALKNSLFYGKISGTKIDSLFVVYYQTIEVLQKTETVHNNYLRNMEYRIAYDYNGMYVRALYDKKLFNKAKGSETTYEEFAIQAKQFYMSNAYQNIVGRSWYIDRDIIDKYYQLQDVGEEILKEIYYLTSTK